MRNLLNALALFWMTGLLGCASWEAQRRGQPVNTAAEPVDMRPSRDYTIVPARHTETTIVTAGPMLAPPTAEKTDAAELLTAPTPDVPKPELPPAPMPALSEIKPSTVITQKIAEANPKHAVRPEILPEPDAPKNGSMFISAHPSVAVEWSGPPAVKVGVAGDYTLTVRNCSGESVQNVAVQVHLPTDVNVVSTSPVAAHHDSSLTWDLGHLRGKEERHFKIVMSSAKHGEVNCQAVVGFNGSAVMKVNVREPKIRVKIQSNERVLSGDTAVITMLVSNPGDHPAEHVKLTAAFDEGLECNRGNKLLDEIGTLNAGETRTVIVRCTAKTAGTQKCEAFADADGLPRAGDMVVLNVLQPHLNVALTGPKVRYVDRKGTFTVKVTNSGDAAASNVFLTQKIPAGFKFVKAQQGGQHTEVSQIVKWFVGEIAPGESKEVSCELQALREGEFVLAAGATGAQGAKAENEFKTTVEAFSAVSLEIFDVDDPVEVGEETTYEVRIANIGSKNESDIGLKCELPPQMKLKSVKAPMKFEENGNQLVFEKLPRLSPKADAVVRVTVTAHTKGDAAFKATLSTANLAEPLVKIEQTKIYGE